MSRSLITLVTLVLLASVAQADDAQRLVPSADGSELIDTSAKLAWSRCVEGMRWDGKHCAGEARLVTHAEALGLARARSGADGRLWRVPRVTELKRLFERLAHGGDAIALAPAAPVGLYWSGSARIESEAVNTYNYRAVERGATERRVDRLSTQQGWAVEQPGGAPHDVAKREKLPVRLVRATDS